MSVANVSAALLPRLAAWKYFVPLALSALFLPACTQQVMQTATAQYLADESDSKFGKCGTALGGYFLPKTFLRIEIKLIDNEHILTDIDERRRGDNRLSFCLDYLSSSFAHDQVIVKKSKPQAANQTGPAASSQFLQVVASRAYDRTSFIIRRFVRAIFIGVGAFGFRNFTKVQVDAAELIKDLEFDPFDVKGLAVINLSLRDAGFCLVVDKYTVGTGVSPKQYCKNPTAYAPQYKAMADVYTAYEAVRVPPDSPGIIYRPRQLYDLLIYTKDDPKGGEEWKLRRIHHFYAENLAPVLALRVDRTLFATKKTALVFNDGMLKNVCISKTSELNEALDIPLEVVKSIVRLPTEVIMIQYDQFAEANKLIDAERQLLDAQQDHMKVLQAVSGVPAFPGAQAKLKYDITGLTPEAAGGISEIGQCPPSTQGAM